MENFHQVKVFLTKYFKRHFRIHSLFPPAVPEDKAMGFNSFQLSRGRRIFLFLINISHWICLAVFFVSVLLADGLHWDLKDFHVPFVAKAFDPLKLLKTVCVSGLIGFGTNYLAIQMLFHPVEKRPIWGQGLVPGQRDRIIYTLSTGMHKHILAQEIILKNLHLSGLPQRVADLVIDGFVGLVKDSELKSEIRDWIIGGMKEYFGKEEIKKEIIDTIDQKVGENLEGGLKKFLVNTYKNYQKGDYERFIQKMIEEVPPTAGKVIDKLGTEKTDEMVGYLQENRAALEDVILHAVTDLLNRLDIPELLRKQMAHFDESTLEKMIWEATNEQLLYIQNLGTILGILGGLIIEAPLLMISFYAVLLLILGGIDVLIMRRRRKNAV
ncbi:MAG: DUF445 domain-containing protein [Bacteroidia bacterium]